ncbi:MAG: hypothetical protein HYR84_05385 [Planctomycetes bacterium]|nr:hypothetical protein [Planctomycetota bacterium]
MADDRYDDDSRDRKSRKSRDDDDDDRRRSRSRDDDDDDRPRRRDSRDDDDDRRDDRNSKSGDMPPLLMAAAITAMVWGGLNVLGNCFTSIAAIVGWNQMRQIDRVFGGFVGRAQEEIIGIGG